MNVLKYLQTHSLDELSSIFGIKLKEYEHFVGLNYSQIESPKSDPITIECRSLKLLKPQFNNGEWAVASRSFDRFFNFGEAPDQYAKFDFNEAVVMEKVDGSIIPIWYNSVAKKWEISSRSAIFGESEATDGDTFRNHVLKTFECDENNFQIAFSKNANTHFTYIFEYIGPKNHIVTPYSNSMMVLLGIRNNLNGHYLNVEQLTHFLDSLTESVKNTRLTKIYHLNSFHEIIESIKEFKNIEEGYVCWDIKHDLRVKIKSPQYVAIHQMRGEGNITPNKLALIVLNGETDEVIAYFPEMKEDLQKLQSSKVKLFEHLENVYLNLKDIQLQKDFAKEALKHKFSNLLFLVRKNNTSIVNEFNNSQEAFKVDLLLNFHNK